MKVLNIEKIITNKINICDKNLKLPTVDLIYLYGVFHHLHDYKQAIINFSKCTRLGGKIFLRIYRSGSLNFFGVNFLRKFLVKHKKDLIKF